ncbi:hypothetical protein HY620_01380 [Candidatus Uhrbacteria bacterium]|nr:hypothetical protein [Candidatus Uhrbacteria bacterium]
MKELYLFITIIGLIVLTGLGIYVSIKARTHSLIQKLQNRWIGFIIVSENPNSTLDIAGAHNVDVVLKQHLQKHDITQSIFFSHEAHERVPIKVTASDKTRTKNLKRLYDSLFAYSPSREKKIEDHIIRNGLNLLVSVEVRHAGFETREQNKEFYVLSVKLYAPNGTCISAQGFTTDGVNEKAIEKVAYSIIGFIGEGNYAYHPSPTELLPASS